MLTLTEILSVDANPKFDPGFETELNGNKYKYVFMTGGISSAFGVTLAPFGTGVYPTVQFTAGAPPNDSIFGITLTQIFVPSFGFVQIGGSTLVRVNDPALAVGDYLQGGAGGNLVRLANLMIQQRSVKILSVPIGGVGIAPVYMF